MPQTDDDALRRTLLQRAETLAAPLAACLPPDGAAALFSRPDLQAAGVFAPRGQAVAATQGGVAGYRISGRRAWGSATHNAHLVSGGCVVLGADGQPGLMSGGQPRVPSALFDRAQLHLLDNWRSVGLGGTGSGEFEAVDVFVPASRCRSLFGTPQQPGVMYRFPVFGLLALGIAAVASGIARQAIDTLLALAADKLPQGSSKTLAQRIGFSNALFPTPWHSAQGRTQRPTHSTCFWMQAEICWPLTARPKIVFLGHCLRVMPCPPAASIGTANPRRQPTPAALLAGSPERTVTTGGVRPLAAPGHGPAPEAVPAPAIPGARGSSRPAALPRSRR